MERDSSYTVEPQGEAALSFEPFVPWWFVCLLVVFVLGGAFVAYLRSTRPLKFWQRMLLWSLRSLAALVIVLCLTRPVLVQAKVLRERGLCYLVVDSSASMNLRDAPLGQSRWEFAGHLFASHQDELAELGRRFEVRRLTFDAVPRETPHLPGEEAFDGAMRPDGRATDLATLLDRVASESGGSSCAGLLLISDGRHNTPRDPLPAARALKSAGVPILAIGVGQEATPQDYREIAVKVLEVPERAFVKSQIEIRVEIEAHLPEPFKVPLTVTINNEKIKEELLDLPAGDQVLRRTLTYTPQALGVHRVVASMPALPKEANINNNQKSAYFRVYKSRLGIWYVEGQLRKEFGSLRGALETAPNVNLKAFYSFARSPDEGPDASLLPDTEEVWRDLRLIMLGDLPAKRFTSEQLERLVKFVNDGGSVLMLGGKNNLGLGGWQRSPLAEVFPVEMGAGDGETEKFLPLELTPDGATHPATRLSEDAVASLELWRKLPPMPGVNNVLMVKPAARTLVKAGEHPLLVVQEYGKGRSAVFTGDATWQWVLKAGQDDAHRRFWRSLVAWLTRSDYRDADKVVFVETDRLQAMLGDEVNLIAHIQETEAVKGKIQNARVTATLELEGGAKKTWDMGQGLGEFATRQFPQVPGNYNFKVEAFDEGGAALGSDSIGFRVDVLDVENDNPKANLKLLERLAVASDGTYYSPEHATEAFAELLRHNTGFSKTVREPTELWNHWSLFVIFMLLLTAEWIVRKRLGLI